MHFSKIAVAGLLPLALAAPVALEARNPPKMEPDYKTLAKVLLLKHLENLYPVIGGGKGDTYPPAGGYPPTGPSPAPAPAPAPAPVYPPAGGNPGTPGGAPGGQPPVYPPSSDPVGQPPLYPDNNGGGQPGDYPSDYPGTSGGVPGGTPGGDLPVYPPAGVPGGIPGGKPLPYPDNNTGGDYAGDDYDDADYGYGSKYDYRSLATEVAALAKRQNQGSPLGNIIPIEVLRGGKISVLNDSLNKLTAALGLGILGSGTAAATPLNLG